MNYSNSSTKATSALRKIIEEHGPLRFDEYMNLALYEPVWGYYAQEPNQVGKDGDFYTSVSCGPLFGMILAERIAAWWRESNIQGRWRIIEPGPNNGVLAIDVMTALIENHPDAVLDVEYITVDPLPVPRAYQSQLLQKFSGKIRCLESTEVLEPLPGFVIANEIIDALPCRLIEIKNATWHEVYVNCDNDSCTEILRPCDRSSLPPALADASAFAEGYRTEFRESVLSFFRSLVQPLSSGRLLFFDYGFAAPELYHPDRTKGTLRVYQNHQATEQALATPGQADITAHVNFTELATTASEFQCAVIAYEPQEFYLTRHSATKLEKWCKNAKARRNFVSLTHPAHLGGKFHAIEFSLSENKTADPTALRRLVMNP